jgi:TrmH family RNA methyltransferase
MASQCWVVLDGPQDPGNLGTIARTSDAVGAPGLILLGESADPYDPTALRASMGTMFSQHLVRASRPDFASWKRRQALTVVGTSGTAPTEYRSVEYRPPLLLLMGSERLGLSAEQQALCDLMVRIPMVGRSDSLNLAVATGLLLYEVFHQQRARP